MSTQIILHDAVRKRWLRFSAPLRIIATSKTADLRDKLQEVEAQVQQGFFAAGFLSYEAAPAFDAALRVRETADFPRLWFGIFTAPEETLLPPAPTAAVLPETWTAAVDSDAYRRAVEAIQGRIARGETYQVNYTFPLRAPFSGDPWSAFLHLANAQQAPYGAFIDSADFAICSASPELFFRLDGQHLCCRPMKGTAPRGRTLDEDEARRRWLQTSVKNRAENLMIVDMLRNDLGRVAETGSVRAEELFTTERYPTLWQLTSSVTARTSAAVSAILGALFPCASITGAPKVRTMELIADLEATPRRIYTGSIGFLGPGRQAQFNVAIRTLLIDKRTQTAEFGVGSGILWDSAASEEAAECATKARILFRQRPPFSLLETLLWTPEGGYFLRERHLQRLARSAAYFGYDFDSAAAEAQLNALAATFNHQHHKVRLLLDCAGQLAAQGEPWTVAPGRDPVRLQLAPRPVASSDPRLFHKTSDRRLYQELAAACTDADEVLLWNEGGEVTETAIANVVVRRDGRLITPALDCGLLPGTLREELLERGVIEEGRIDKNELKGDSEIYLINSVRQWRRARLV